MCESIRHGENIPVAAVGLLDDPILADGILQEGRADLIGIGRGFMRNRNWGYNAAIALRQPFAPPKRPYLGPCRALGL
jgi:NADPH2 dehydrogenase